MSVHEDHNSFRFDVIDADNICTFNEACAICGNLKTVNKNNVLEGDNRCSVLKNNNRCDVNAVSLKRLVDGKPLKMTIEAVSVKIFIGQML